MYLTYKILSFNKSYAKGKKPKQLTFKKVRLKRTDSTRLKVQKQSVHCRNSPGQWTQKRDGEASQSVFEAFNYFETFRNYSERIFFQTAF